jgi:uncharacterized protein YndB with AHSA1/START domain
MQPAPEIDLLELTVERVIDAPRDAVWQAWTDHLEEWWSPRPWTVELVELDMRPGGRSAMIMRGPNGEGGEVMEGVFLEVVPAEKVVFTDAFKAGWVPSTPFMVGFFELSDAPGGKTHYRAGARHWSEENFERHKTMGFYQGWGKVAEQLEDVAKRVAENIDA